MAGRGAVRAERFAGFVQRQDQDLKGSSSS